MGAFLFVAGLMVDGVLGKAVRFYAAFEILGLVQAVAWLRRTPAQG